MKREGGAMWFWISLSHHQRSGGEEKKLLKRIWVHSVQEMQPSDKLITITWHCFIIIDLEKSQGSSLTKFFI